jgi:hypothetical protein
LEHKIFNLNIPKKIKFIYFILNAID